MSREIVEGCEASSSRSARTEEPQKQNRRDRRTAESDPKLLTQGSITELIQKHNTIHRPLHRCIFTHKCSSHGASALRSPRPLTSPLHTQVLYSRRICITFAATTQDRRGFLLIPASTINIIWTRPCPIAWQVSLITIVTATTCCGCS